MGERFWVNVSKTADGGKRRRKLHIAYDGEKTPQQRKPKFRAGPAAWEEVEGSAWRRV